MSEKGNKPTIDYLCSLIIDQDAEELADWTEEEHELFKHFLEREGILPEDGDEMLEILNSIAVMEIAGADFEFGPGEYWRKVKEILAKYTYLPEVWEKLAYECPYSDTYDADSDYPPGTTALMCTIGPEKNSCPEGPETCCAQCPRETLCPKTCMQFEGLARRGIKNE